jgi:thymidylate synthase
MNNYYQSANSAYEHTLIDILNNGRAYDNTLALFNVGFYLIDPLKNEITNRKRKWSKEYAEAEWQWYLTGDPHIQRLGRIYGKIPTIWTKMADPRNSTVNSNYGWQWQRNKQIDKIIDLLRKNPETRKAAISIYDGKEINKYSYDTPCTYAIQFTIVDKKLNMCVTMRSNDIWYGFCNDQYCFSKLQEMISNELCIKIGTYYHFAHNMHLYEDKLKQIRL